MDSEVLITPEDVCEASFDQSLEKMILEYHILMRKETKWSNILLEEYLFCLLRGSQSSLSCFK